MLILNILISITFTLQIVALTISLRLMRITKYNAAWILFSIAFFLMIIQLLSEIFFSIKGAELIDPNIMIWIWVLTSLCFTSGLFVTHKLINYINEVEKRRISSQKRVLNTVITTEEKERRRFSNDLHDGLGPLLSSAKLSISALNSTTKDDTDREILKSAEAVINEAIKSLKEISNNLNPHVLNNFGISRALNSFINKLNLPDDMNITFKTTLGGNRYNSNIEAIIYRVVCELINNSIKHSKAKKIEVELIKNSTDITAIVADNGVGFDYEKTEAGECDGMGLSSIISRISSIKGDFNIDTTLGKGTIVTIKIKA